MNTNNKNKPHKHAKLIKAWADGAKIQYWNESLHKWIDKGDPLWYEWCEYRIKPEEPSNEPWKPKADETFYIVSDMGYAVKCTWMDGCVYHNDCYAHGNCFRTEKEAEAAAERVEAALKGDTTDDMKVWITENDIEGGLQLTIGELKKWYRKLNKENEMVLKLDVPYLDGNQLSDGEKALIRAIRNLGIHEVFKDDGLLVFKDENNNLETDGDVVAFSSMGQNSTIREVLNKIKKEQDL